MNESQVKSYFNSSSETYTGGKHPSSLGSREKVKVDEMLSDLVNDNARVLDIGCGDGLFIEYCLHQDVIESGVGLDISEEMLLDLTSGNHETVIGSALNLPFDSNANFDVVHICNVLHHLVGTSRQESKEKALKCLQSAFEVTNEDGHLIITEQCYEGPLPRSQLTSKIIFEGLRYLSPIAKIAEPEAQDGLIVSFFTRKELRDIIGQADGEIIKERRRKIPQETWLRRILIHDRSRVDLIVTQS